MKKEIDPRIAELTSMYHSLHYDLYKYKPKWDGKEAKLLESCLKSFDARGLTLEQFMDCLKTYMKNETTYVKANKHAFAPFAVDPAKFLPIDEARVKHGERMIQRVKEVFDLVPVKEYAEHEFQHLVDGLKRTYPDKTEDNCRAWIKSQKYMLHNLAPKPGSRIYKYWMKSGKAAKAYFGDEMVNKLWKEPIASETQAEKVRKQAQELLTQENK